MSSFKISFLKLLRNSAAMTFLFLPAVSAMQDDWEGWQSCEHLLTQSSSSSSSSSSIGFEQIDEEKTATVMRSSKNLGEPQKLYFFDDRRFIKGEVPGDGTCFLHTLNILFPEKKISRDAFATRLRSSFKGEDSRVSKQDIREEFAAELYTQLNQYKVQRGKGASLEFTGPEINKLSMHLLNDMPHNYFDFPENSIYIREIIAGNDKIIEEMLAGFAKTHVMLSLPPPELGNIGSFGLACKFFDINLDIYAPIGETNLLERWKNFSFGDASPPQVALYAHAHVSPLCFEEDIETRKRFAENEVQVILESDVSNKLENTLDYIISTYPRSPSANLPMERQKSLLQKAKMIVLSTGCDPDTAPILEAYTELFGKDRDISQRLQYILSYMETTHRVKKILDLSPIEREGLFQTAKKLVLDSGVTLDTGAIKAAYKKLYGENL
jgi:hypothetical protein